MDRHKAIALTFTFAFTLAFTFAFAKGRAVTLQLGSLDLAHRLVRVEVDGLSKPPPANFFTFTDERGRHFVPMTIHCDEPSTSDSRRCTLEMPVGYQRYKLTSLVLHLHGLHGRTVEVEPAELAAAWEKANRSASENASENEHVNVDGGMP
jgi:hypothetical protein